MSDLAELGETGQLGVWYNPLTWFGDDNQLNAASAFAVGASSFVGAPIAAKLGSNIQFADSFFNGQIANGLEKESSNQHRRYRELRDARPRIGQLSGPDRARAESVFRQAKQVLDEGTRKLNLSISKHDEAVQTVKKYKFYLSGYGITDEAMPELQTVGRFDPPQAGLSGLADLGVPPVIVGLGAWIAANPVSFVISATVLAALTALLATYAAALFAAMLAALTAFLAMLPGMEGIVEKFKSIFNVIFDPIKQGAKAITAVSFLAVAGIAGFLIWRYRSKKA